MRIKLKNILNKFGQMLILLPFHKSEVTSYKSQGHSCHQVPLLLLRHLQQPSVAVDFTQLRAGKRSVRESLLHI